MKKLRYYFIALALIPTLSLANQITITVTGMVCAFCAQGIEKKFAAEDSVAKVRVDLDQKTVDLDLKPGVQIDDRRIMKLVNESGFNVKKIERK